ncbi:MAG: CPBP family intramembrane glutamic endopeptidase [Anaerolineaceae bacterium]
MNASLTPQTCQSTSPIPQTHRRLTLLAWGVVILISALPEMLILELFHGSIAQAGYVKMGFLLALVISSSLWRPLQPLRSFFLVMLAFFVLGDLRIRIDFTLPWLQTLFGGHAFDARMQAEQTGKLVMSLLMILMLAGLGYRRKQMFLTPGNLKAPITPVKWLGFPKPDAWPVFGLQWGFYIALAIAAMLYFNQRPTGADLAAVLPVIPSILFYAALNAFNEEVTYRISMLTTLEPLAGSRQVLWMAAFFFGIGHYFGVPGGVAGAIASIFMGWILSKAMLETRGLFWAWWIHFLSDVAIFAFLAAALR